MATYDDLVSVLNNPYTNPGDLSLGDALAQRNNRFTKMPSVGEAKEASVKDKVAEKLNRLSPKVIDTYYGGEADSDLLDLAEASLYKAGGNLADVGRGISNSLFGTEFDDSEESGWSSQRNADAAAGVSLGYRQNLNQDYSKVLESVADDDYWGATKGALNVATRAAADSFATVPELIAGTALTAVGGSGAALLANKARKMTETAEDISKKYDQIKKAKKGPLGKVLTEAGRASVLTADIVQQQRNKYKELNDGEEPSAQRLAGMTLLTLATTIWQPSIARNFHLPKRAKKVEPSVGKDGKPKSKFSGELEALKKEAQDYVKAAEKGTVSMLANRVGEGIKHIAIAGGTEAVQEYAQFWAETLGVEMKPDETKGFLEAAYDVFTREGGNDEAIAAAFTGAGAGGATKAVTSVPKAAAGGLVDVAYKTSEGIKNKVQDATIGKLSDSDILAKSAEDKNRAEITEKFSQQSADKITRINEATSIKDLAGQHDVIEELSAVSEGKNLEDSNIFDSAKNAAVRKLRSGVVAAQVATGGKRAATVAKNVAKKAEEVAKKQYEKIPEEYKQKVEAAVDTVKAFSEKTKTALMEEVENYPQSTTLALVEAAGSYANKKSREGFKQLKAKALEAGPEQVRKLAEVVKEDAPHIAAELNKSADSMERASKKVGLRTDKLTTVDNMPKSIASASTSGIVKDNDFLTTVDAVTAVAKGTFDSKESAEMVVNTVKALKNTDNYESLNDAEKITLSRIEKKAVNEAKAWADSNVVTQAKEKTKEAVKTSVDFVSEKLNLDLDIDLNTDSGQLRSKFLSALDSAFVKLTTEPEEKSETGETVDIKDAKGEVVKSVTAGKKLKRVHDQLQQQEKLISEKPEGEKTKYIEDTISYFTAEKTVKSLAKMLETNDPEVVHGFISHVFKPFNTDAYGKRTKKAIQSALGSETDNTTETSKRDFTGGVIKAVVDGEVINFVNEKVSETDINDFIKNYIGEENICKTKG